MYSNLLLKLNDISIEIPWLSNDIKPIWYFCIQNYKNNETIEYHYFESINSLNYLKDKSIVLKKYLKNLKRFELILDETVFDFLSIENIILLGQQESKANIFFDYDVIEKDYPEYYI
jgi:hypothetical protein